MFNKSKSEMKTQKKKSSHKSNGQHEMVINTVAGPTD